MQISGNKHIYTVSQVTEEIKRLLEDNFPFIWINGEITNSYSATSGHHYFDLKDKSATIKAVIFQGQVKNLRFDLENGLEIIGFGRISVYGPRGTYQIILEYIEPAGIGALQIAFEQLKNRLEKEGLFAQDRKKPLPPIPATIGVVTSLAGAVIHDIEKVLFRRFNNLRLIIAPAKVQGVEAEHEIVAAIDMLNRHNQADIVILARGGGSLEDLQAFNSEAVARAIQASRIPIVSAVGHEVDFTIADFVADLRAPTPSAAAEIIVPEKDVLVSKIIRIRSDLVRSAQAYIRENRHRIGTLSAALKSPRRRIDEYHLNLDHITGRMTRWMQQNLRENRHRLVLRKIRLVSISPKNDINKYKQLNTIIINKLFNLKNIYIQKQRSHIARLLSTLTALNPMAILQRGYSITRSTVNGKQKTVMDANRVKMNQSLEILLARGTLKVRVNDRDLE